jgi:O-antigen/teichoic acid export membrane protein
MTEYKLFVQRIGLIGIMNVLVALSSLILLPILTKNYSVQDYGVWVMVYTTMMLLPYAVTLGLPYALIRFLSGQEEIKKIQEAFYSIATIITFISILTSFLLFLFEKPLSYLLFNGNLAVGSLLPLLIFLANINLLFLNFFITFQEIKKYSLFTLIQAYLNIILIIIFAYFDYGIFYAVLAILISQLTITIFMLALIIRKIGFKIPKFENLKEYLSFSIPTVPSNLSGWVVDSSDRYVINISLGTEYVGFYNPAYSAGNIIKMFFYPFATILTPSLSENYNLGKEKIQMKVLLEYSTKYFLAIAIPSSFGLSILAYPLLNILTTPEIAMQGYLVVPFVAVSGMFYGLIGIVNQVLFLEKKTKIGGFILSMSAILNFCLCIIFVPIFGIISAAFVTLLSYMFSFILITVYTSRDFDFDFDLKFILKSILASIVMSVIIVNFHPTNIVDIIIAILISVITYFLILILIKGINREEFKLLKSILK